MHPHLSQPLWLEECVQIMKSSDKKKQYYLYTDYFQFNAQWNIYEDHYWGFQFKVWTWGCTVLQTMFCVYYMYMQCVAIKECCNWNNISMVRVMNYTQASATERTWCEVIFIVYSKLITHSDNVSQIRPASYGEDNGLMLWRLIQVRLYGEYCLSTVVVTWWSLAYRITGEWPLTFSLAVSESKSSSMSCETTLTCLMKQPRKLTLCNI